MLTPKRVRPNGLPFSGGSLDLREGLTEAGSVKSFLLGNCKLLPVSLLLFSKLCNITSIFLESDSWKGMHNTVNVSGLTIATISHNFSFANVNLGQGQWNS